MYSVCIACLFLLRTDNFSSEEVINKPRNGKSTSPSSNGHKPKPKKRARELMAVDSDSSVSSTGRLTRSHDKQTTPQQTAKKRTTTSADKEKKAKAKKQKPTRTKTTDQPRENSTHTEDNVDSVPETPPSAFNASKKETTESNGHILQQDASSMHEEKALSSASKRKAKSSDAEFFSGSDAEIDVDGVSDDDSEARYVALQAS